MRRTSVCSNLVCLLVFGTAIPALAGPSAEALGSVRDVRDFDKVEIGIVGEIILTQGDAKSLEIAASAADLARISTSVRMGTLRINAVRPDDSPRGPVTYRLTMKQITSLETNSAGNITVQTIETDRLGIAIHSSGSVAIGTLKARSLGVEISSSGIVTVAGTVERQVVRSSSSGEYRAENLASREATVELSSSGRATIRVSEQLTAKLSSGGDVRYHGNPPKVTSTSSSSGKVVKLD